MGLGKCRQRYQSAHFLKGGARSIKDRRVSRDQPQNQSTRSIAVAVLKLHHILLLLHETTLLSLDPFRFPIACSCFWLRSTEGSIIPFLCFTPGLLPCCLQLPSAPQHSGSVHGCQIAMIEDFALPLPLPPSHLRLTLVCSVLPAALSSGVQSTDGVCVLQSPYEPMTSQTGSGEGKVKGRVAGVLPPFMRRQGQVTHRRG